MLEAPQPHQNTSAIADARIINFLPGLAGADLKNGFEERMSACGTKRTSSSALHMSAFDPKRNISFDPFRN